MKIMLGIVMVICNDIGNMMLIYCEVFLGKRSKKSVFLQIQRRKGIFGNHLSNTNKNMYLDNKYISNLSNTISVKSSQL